MTLVLERTCWRDVQIDHPADWELCYASSESEPGRCTFADRLHQRLDIRWRPVKYVPNLALMLDKYRSDHGRTVSLQALGNVGDDWQGLVRRDDSGSVTHAMRFFRERRLLLEATVVWPGQPDVQLEREILLSISVAGDSPARLWRAMGLAVSLDRQYQLTSSQSQVGRVAWTFAGPAKSHTTLSIERLAMPEYWIKTSLSDWLEDELPSGYRLATCESISFAGHQATQTVSRAHAGALPYLLGKRALRTDIAWQCDAQQRVYRIVLRAIRRPGELCLPSPLDVCCCES